MDEKAFRRPSGDHHPRVGGPATTPAVIVVEDEADLRDSMRIYLAASGFDARCAADGIAFDAAWRERQADILVIDINLPGESGFSIAARMRGISPTVGIVILTGRGQAHDRVAGLELGADNYLVKPLVMLELAAAIRRLWTRLAPPVVTEVARHWSFDDLDWSLVAPGGGRVELTAAEFNVLSVLAASPGHPFAAETILQALGKIVTDANRRSLDSLVSRLRRKVEAATGAALPIKAVRAVGYVFAAPLARGPRQPGPAKAGPGRRRAGLIGSAPEPGCGSGSG